MSVWLRLFREAVTWSLFAVRHGPRATLPGANQLHGGQHKPMLRNLLNDVPIPNTIRDTFRLVVLKVHGHWLCNRLTAAVRLLFLSLDEEPPHHRLQMLLLSEVKEIRP